MRTLTLLAVTALTGAAFAQQTHSPFNLYGSQTSFTSRGGVGVQSGEALQGYHTSHLLGLAENNGNGSNRSCKLTRLTVFSQDQNCSTSESFDFVVRSGDDMNGPMAGTAKGALLGEIKGLKTPTRGNSTCTFMLTTNLTSSAYIDVGCPTAKGTTIESKFFAMGIRMSAAPGWTTDGQSIHVSFGTSANPHQNSWTETVATGAPDHAWEIVGTATLAKHPSGNRCWQMSWYSEGVALQLGCGYAYGMGGMFPRSSSSSSPLAYTALMRGGANMGGASSVVVVSPRLFPGIVPMGSGASLYVHPGGMVMWFGPKAKSNGEVVIWLANYLPLLNPPAGFKVPFQGAMDHPSTGLRLSNVMFCEPK